jgi:hypothetical protein
MTVFLLSTIVAACTPAPAGSSPEPVSTSGSSQTPSLTNTPVPTATPVPPTATIDADLTVYDNFNNPANDGKFNASLWDDTTNAVPDHDIVQQNGFLKMRGSGSVGSTVLEAILHRNFALDQSMFFEAKLMSDAKEHHGNIQLNIDASLPGNQSWFSQCIIDDLSDAYGSANCWDTIWPWQQGRAYTTGTFNFKHGTWHLFRIEIDPKTMTFTYFVDQRQVGHHVPKDADLIKSAPFTLTIGTWGPDTGAITGYVDDVRVGTLTK